jgi:hypothetical protein
MRTSAKPGFWLVARREWRWLLHDRVALILIFGVPLGDLVSAARAIRAGDAIAAIYIPTNFERDLKA